MGKQIGSQYRETLKDAGLRIAWPTPRGYVLQDKETGAYSLWERCDDFAGYVVEIEGVGHEFLSSTDQASRPARLTAAGSG